MRLALVIAALLSLASLVMLCSKCFAQNNVNPQDPPHFYEGDGTWADWKPVPQFPLISLRGACGDETELNGIPMFTLYTQIRSRYAYPIAMVWADEAYIIRVKKNIISGSFLEYLDPGQITEGISELAGHCNTTNVFYAKIKCVARKGDEGATCFKDAQGNPIAQRTDQFRSLPRSNGASKSGMKTGSAHEVVYFFCEARPTIGPDPLYVTPMLRHSLTTSEKQAGTQWLDTLGAQYIAWLRSRYSDVPKESYLTYYQSDTAEGAEQLLQVEEEPFHQNNWPVITVKWSPNQ